MASVVAERVCKAFGGTQALDDVSLRVEAGEIHGLLGANGSGKSTLVKVLTAVEHLDRGTVSLSDHQLQEGATPTDVARLGVRVVFQEAPLVDTLSVAESVALFRGFPRNRFGKIDWDRLHREVSGLFARLDIDVDPRATGGSLKPAERALVALSIAFDGIEKDGHLLILDEATASLQESEAEAFLSRVKALAGLGIGVLMVTHRINEVAAIADSVTILSNGRVAYTGPAADADEDFIISKMLGQPGAAPTAFTAGVSTPLAQMWQASGRDVTGAAPTGPVLEVSGVTGHSVGGVSFTLDHGEIIGITGLPSSGVADLPYMLAGSLDRDAGTIVVDGHPIGLVPEPSEAIAAGVGLVPADRLHQGGLQSSSLVDNIVLPDARRYWHRRNRRTRVMAAVFDAFRVLPARYEALFGQLSGGNQQKVVLAKWLMIQPKVLILDDPTSGVDPHSRRLIFDAVRAAAESGIGVVLLSNEHEQLIDMCDRVLVLRAGAVAAELTGPGMTLESIARWSFL